ncbi:MAG: malate synthase A [Hyphomicrobiales bacterium]
MAATTLTSAQTEPTVALRAPIRIGYDRILTHDALEFVADLTRRFRPRIEERLRARVARRRRIEKGQSLDFAKQTAAIRARDWKVPPPPRDLLKRVVEITGPVDRKMVINALNSGADVFMADFEDSNAPTWDNNVQGQVNLRDAIRREIAYDDPATGKSYRLNEATAVLMVRPRGLHLPERHLTVDGLPVPGCLFDFGLYFFHNAGALMERGTGPYFYLPKLESHLEARLWHDVFAWAESKRDLPPGTIRATVLIETLPAAFEMDEILYELKEHASGLNCGRWDYIFSYIKTLRHDPAALLPDRSLVTMAQPFLRAYTQLAVKTCHRRGAHAIGGMAAQIPIKNDDAANEAALAKVRADKEREVGDGHDGTWVAHPGLVPIARQTFEARMTGPNQIERLREDVNVRAADLLRVPEGVRTEDGLRLNVRVGIRYLEAWLRGNGCVPLYHLMEDAATSEISRAQVWQWIRHGARLEDGRLVTPDLLRSIVREEMKRIAREVGPAAYRGGRFTEARALFVRLSIAKRMQEFLTLPAYDMLDHDSTATPAEEERHA